MEEHEYCAGSSKQVTNFEVVTNYIINNTQENLDKSHNVAESLRVLTNLGTVSWRPTSEVSEVEGEAARDRESREFELNFKGE